MGLAGWRRCRILSTGSQTTSAPLAVIQLEHLRQVAASPVHPAFDRADLAAELQSRGLVLHALDTPQKKRFTLHLGQSHESLLQLGDHEMTFLPRQGDHASRIASV